MSNQKKRILALGVLLIVLFALAISDRDISMLEYSYMFINAVLFMLLLFSFQTRIESQNRRILRQSGMIFHFMTGSGRYDIIKKVEAMPKVMSATGQIYVDYDDVLEILRGDELVER